MSAAATTRHVEAVMERLGTLTLAETRTLYSTPRLCEFDEKEDTFISNALIPAFGVTVGEIGVAYVINSSSRSGRR